MAGVPDAKVYGGQVLVVLQRFAVQLNRNTVRHLSADAGGLVGERYAL